MIRAAIVTISDSRTVESDLSGNKLAEILAMAEIELIDRVIIVDDIDRIKETLYALTEKDGIDLIVTTGGTGFGPRDNTPEATSAVITREAPGLAEAMRRETSAKTPTAILSRGVCGIRGKTLIVNLPGSPKGVSECFEVIRLVLQHAVDQLRGNAGH